MDPRAAIPNPWLALPTARPFVLADDASAINDFNKRASKKTSFDLSLHPEPYFGAPSAPVILLALNPGRKLRDAEVHAKPAFAKIARLSLEHKLTVHPFLHLQPNMSTPGAEWWRRIAKVPIEELDDERAVAKSICCIQFFPYHSEAFASARLRVPSQQYSFDLVRRALRRGAEVVVMRAWKLWSAAVPELVGYERLHFLRNPRNPTLSSRNLGDGFDAVLDRFRSGA